MSYVPQVTQQRLVALNKLSVAEFETFCENSIAAMLKESTPITPIEILVSNFI